MSSTGHSVKQFMMPFVVLESFPNLMELLRKNLITKIWYLGKYFYWLSSLGLDEKINTASTSVIIFNLDPQTISLF